jgi:hypothetical protein
LYGFSPNIASFFEVAPKNNSPHHATNRLVSPETIMTAATDWRVELGADCRRKLQTNLRRARQIVGMKIRKKRQRVHDDETANQCGPQPDYVEVGQGDYCVVTMNWHDGSIVAQRFETREEAEAQHRRNTAYDKPLVGVGRPN